VIDHGICSRLDHITKFPPHGYGKSNIAYLTEHNANPKPFVWTKSAEAILAKLDRCPVPSV
jgi:hypothetical protein